MHVFNTRMRTQTHVHLRRSKNHAYIQVPHEWEGRKIIVNFESVSSAFYIWVNGLYVVNAHTHTHTHSHGQKERERERKSDRKNKEAREKDKVLYVVHAHTHIHVESARARESEGARERSHL